MNFFINFFHLLAFHAFIRFHAFVPGANVNHQDVTLNTPLHFAFEYGHFALASWLIERHGADDGALNAAGGSVYDGLCGPR